MNSLTDEFIHSWLKMNLVIKENKYLQNFSFNEIAVCHFLYKNELAGNEYMTATALTETTQILKSQLNLVLKRMKKKKIISRKKNKEDKRIYEIRFTDYGRDLYLKEHNTVIDIAEDIINNIGKENTKIVMDSFYSATEVFINRNIVDNN